MDDDKVIGQLLDQRAISNAEKELRDSGRDAIQDFERFINLIRDWCIKGLPQYEDDRDEATGAAAPPMSGILGNYMGARKEEPRQTAAEKRLRLSQNWIQLGFAVKDELDKRIATAVAAELYTRQTEDVAQSMPALSRKYIDRLNAGGATRSG